MAAGKHLVTAIGYPGYTRIGWGAAEKPVKRIAFALLVDGEFRPKAVPYDEYIALNPDDKPGDEYLDAMNYPDEPGEVNVIRV